MKTGSRHLIKCRCILPQFKSLQNPPNHEFLVFSMFEDDNPIVKFAQCNNCGIVHKVLDLCKSEIVVGKEQLNSMITIDDVKLTLPPQLIEILQKYDVDVSAWEQAQFIIENSLWGEIIVLRTDVDSGIRQGKYLRILGSNLFKIESFVRDEYLG